MDIAIGHAGSAWVDLPTPSGSGTPGSLWLLDSGASLHMTSDPTHLTHYSSAPSISRVRITYGTPLLVSSIGHLTTSVFFVPDVSYVPRLSMNLTSVSQLTDFDCQVVFDHSSCHVQDRNGAVIGVGRRRSGVYILESLCLPSPPVYSSHYHVVTLDFY